MSEDAALRKCILGTPSLHLFIDVIIAAANEEPPEIAKSALRVLHKLMQSKKNGVYIPGQTLDNEKQRIRIMQHGWILAVLHILQNTKNEELLRLAEDGVKSLCPLQELEWNGKLVERHISGDDKFFNKMKPKTGSIVGEILPEIKNLAHKEEMRAKDAESALIPLMIYTHANFDKTSIDFGTKKNLRSELLHELLPYAGQKAKFHVTQHFDIWQGKELVLSEYNPPLKQVENVNPSIFHR